MKHFIFILVAISAQLGHAQVSSKDSLLNVAMTAIYNDPSQAMDIGLTLLENSKTTEDKLEVLNLLISANAAMRNFDNIMLYAKEADELAQKTKDYDLRIRIYNNLGAQYHGLKLFGKAITYLDIAQEEIASKLEGDAKQQSLGFNSLVRAFVYRDQMGCAIALPLLDASIAHYRSVRHLQTSIRNLSTAHYNKGNCLMNIGNLEEAIKQFELSAAYADSSKAPSLLAFSQKGLAQAYTASGRFEASLQVLDSAKKNAEKIGDPLLSQAIYMSMATNYIALSDLDAASEAKEKTRSIQSSIIQNSNQSVVELLNATADLHKQQISSLSKRHRALMATLVGACIVVVLIFTWKHRRQQSILQELDQSIEALALPSDDSRQA